MDHFRKNRVTIYFRWKISFDDDERFPGIVGGQNRKKRNVMKKIKQLFQIDLI